MKKQLKCYIYTRVFTSMQVDGYSLDVQKDKLHKYADYQDMIIAGEYSDEGKSSKSVEGRPQLFTINMPTQLWALPLLLHSLITTDTRRNFARTIP